MTEYPIELPLNQKKMILSVPMPSSHTCPDCNEVIEFVGAPSEDYTHCTTEMIKWV